MTRADPAVAALQREMAQTIDPVAAGDAGISIRHSDPDIDSALREVERSICAERSIGDLATAAGIAEREAEHLQDEADRAFGASIREAITDVHDAATAQAVMVAFTRPTMPGTPARKLQDRMHFILTARLEKIVSEVVRS